MTTFQKQQCYENFSIRIIDSDITDISITMKFNFFQSFLNAVEERFLCICCQELVVKPVTTECKHNVCQACLQRSFKAEVFSCPACRYDLGKGYAMTVNKPLSECLIKLFPGYDVAR